MTRISSSTDPWSTISDLVKRIEVLERRNPLNAASTDQVIEFEGAGGIKAGNYSLDTSGIYVPWSGEQRTVNSLFVSINSTAATGVADARRAQSRADSAYDHADTGVRRANLALQGVSEAKTAASNAHSRANSAYTLANSKPSQGYVTGRDLALQSQIDWLKDNSVLKPNRATDPPPRVIG